MKKILYLLPLFVTLCACEGIFFEDDMESTSAKKNFDYLWEQCRDKYAYFELKGIDWNKSKAKYEAKIYEGMSEDSLFNVLGAMLTELRDGHTNLSSNFNVSFFPVAHQGQDNLTWRVVEDNYLLSNFYISGPFVHDFIANKQIGYIRFSSFTGTVDPTNLDFILKRYKDTKGLILDLRKNGGGSVVDIFSILDHFVEERTLLYYSRIKTGPGINDFSEAAPAYVEPYNGVRYTKKVAVLTDRGTYSAGSFASLATKALPSMILIGDTTGGGLGLPNGGQLPNGWKYRFSITQALTLDKNPAYENGVPPDIHVLVDPNDRTKDAVIERAIKELL
jgi:hypothetical protein